MVRFYRGNSTDHYEVAFADTTGSINGVAWNQERFALIEVIGDVQRQGYVVLLRDLESDKTVLVASGHLSGCNPFCTPANSSDSAKGDLALQALIAVLDSKEADLKIIAMDSNVTATHPRLALLKEAGYTLDCENYLEATCTNPWQVLDTRIDWITIRSSNQSASISNIPVLGVGLNSPQTNISDHKPVAARITQSD
ncbi:MAG: hypothetical protein S4CHLAM123_00940 [Chlamydiales bacterium]|nr:hypothetical protein [Chlamydiales bacterium]